MPGLAGSIKTELHCESPKSIGLHIMRLSRLIPVCEVYNQREFKSTKNNRFTAFDESPLFHERPIQQKMRRSKSISILCLRPLPIYKKHILRIPVLPTVNFNWYTISLPFRCHRLTFYHVYQTASYSSGSSSNLRFLPSGWFGLTCRTENKGTVYGSCFPQT